MPTLESRTPQIDTYIDPLIGAHRRRGGDAL